MKKNTIRTLLTCLWLVNIICCNAQNHTLHIGDTLRLKLSGYRGNLQIQESTDSILWKDVDGGNYVPYAIIFTSPKYYRMKITEGSCNPVYSEVTKTIKAISTGIQDVDGNFYDTVRIGNQLWIKQNLKTSHLNDGTVIPLTANNSAWNNLTTPGYSWYNNDSVKYGYTYGAIYNWYAVNTGKLCPTGWHVPSDSEWMTLSNYLGGDSISGRKLKEAGLSHWLDPNLGANNLSGFTALPGGRRYYDGSYYYMGIDGFWWTSTEFNILQSWYVTLTSWYEFIEFNFEAKNLGYSVRCMKD